MEGTVLGIPSFALSQAYAFTTKHHPYWDTAITMRPISSGACSRPACRATCWSTSISRIVAPGEVAGVAVAVQGKRDQELLRIEARHDGRGNPYYWIAFGRGGIVGAAPGSDLAALNEKRISVTPLRLDLTDEPFMTKLASVLA